MSSTLLSVFLPTFMLVSLTPGMCMTLALSLGMQIGVRRTLWMMWGELFGVALVAIASVVGVAAIMLLYPSLFQWLKWVGGLYLLYVGVKMWRSGSHVHLDQANNQLIQPQSLFYQGLITAIANPKGWAFMIALLPPFIHADQAMAPQIAALVMIILCTEFCALLLYASGGKTLRLVLQRGNGLIWLNRIAGSLIVLIGLWLAVS